MDRNEPDADALDLGSNAVLGDTGVCDNPSILGSFNGPAAVLNLEGELLCCGSKASFGAN